MEYTIRPYRSEDISGIVRATNAADAFFALEDGTSERELLTQFSIPGVNPDKNVFVAEQHGRIVGFAMMRFMSSDEEDSFRTWYQVDPECRGQGLELALLQRLYQRAEELLPECKTEHIRFNTISFAQETERVAAILKFGMTEVRRGWTMVCDTLDQIPDATFPDGIIARPYQMGSDDVALHRADTEIFRDHWGHVDEPLESWQHRVAQDKFKADLSIVAQDSKTGEVAGYCIVEINDEENARLGVKRGWIEILGVRRPYRRKGLGTALVLAGMQHIHDAGLDQAALGCDSQNQTGAVRIYKRLGFHVHRERIIYSKPMSRN